MGSFSLTSCHVPFPKPTMAERQPDDNPAIQSFLRWANAPNTSCLGCRGTKSKIVCPFIPYKRVQAYFTESRRIHALLIALLPEKDVGQLPSTDTIKERYLRVFSILILINRGRFINHFVHHDILDDQHLPLESPSHSWPNSTEAGFFESFYQKQWLFYPAVFERHMDRHLDENRTLPIVEKESLGEGVSAIAQRVVIEEGSNRLTPVRALQRPKVATTFSLSNTTEDECICRQDIQSP